MRPQLNKPLFTCCTMLAADGRRPGSMRELRMTAGLPAWCSTEWLEVLDEEQHVMSFSVVGGGHRLVNYRLTLTMYEALQKWDGGGWW